MTEKARQLGNTPAFWDGSTLNSLTKREYFAGLAMQGFLANSFDNGNAKPLSLAGYEDIAALSVGQADALLNELSKKDEV